MIHATKKNALPNIAQKLPMLDIQKPMAEIIKSIQPTRLIFLFDIFSNFECFNFRTLLLTCSYVKRC